MHKRFLSSIGRRSSKIPLKGFSHEPRTAAKVQQGQESEKAIPDGDSPEASVSRGVVSDAGTTKGDSRHPNVVKETILRVRRTKQSGMTLRSFRNTSLTNLKQGRRGSASTHHRRGRRVKSKRRIRSRASHTEISLQGELSASLRTIQCNNAGTDTGGQSGEKLHQKHRPEVRRHGEGVVARRKGYERTADFEGDIGYFRGTKG